MTSKRGKGHETGSQGKDEYPYLDLEVIADSGMPKRRGKQLRRQRGAGGYEQL